MKLRSQGDVLSQKDREEMLEHKDDVKFHIKGMKSPEQIFKTPKGKDQFL